MTTQESKVKDDFMKLSEDKNFEGNTSYLKEKLQETLVEFQEFRESSRELEIEYETQISNLERVNEESQALIVRLNHENEQLKTRYNDHCNESRDRIKKLEEQIIQMTSSNEKMTTYIRELEQNNDNLSRAKRILEASLEDYETRLNQQLERNALLESESIMSDKEDD